MIRSVWCPHCKKVMNTIIKSGKEVCFRCETGVSRSSAGEPSKADKSGEED